jgi:hypothetical protein
MCHIEVDQRCVCGKRLQSFATCDRNTLALLNKISPVPMFSMTPESTRGFAKSYPWVYHERAPARAPPRRYIWVNNHPDIEQRCIVVAASDY